MSYKATHYLTWDEVVHAMDHIMNPDSQMMGMTKEVPTGTPYDWEVSGEHLGQLSKLWPYVVFSLGCTGDESERCITYARNGQHYTAECRFCDITAADCPERVDAAPETEQASTDDF